MLLDHPAKAFGIVGSRWGEADKAVQPKPNRDPTVDCWFEDAAEMPASTSEVRRAIRGQGSEHVQILTRDGVIEIPAIDDDVVATFAGRPQADQDEDRGRLGERCPLGVRVQFAIAEPGEAWLLGDIRSVGDRRDAIRVTVAV
jgi:hypothetical protein